MNLATLLVLLAVILVVGLSLFAFIRGRKNGSHCSSCPSGASCPHCNSSCNKKEGAKDKA